VEDVQVMARACTAFLEGFIYAALVKAKPEIAPERLVVESEDTAKLDEQTIRHFLER
jgi:hypothetical protein